MIYNPFKTELLIQGEYRKIKCINGLAPLVYLAGIAQEIFFDKEIEKMEQMTVSEIFKKYGEEYFREKEEELIKKIAFKRNVVISTGGGMVENSTIMKYLKYNCHVIYLKRELDKKLFDGKRPKLKSKEDYLLLKERREPLYTKYANICIYNNSSI